MQNIKLATASILSSSILILGLFGLSESNEKLELQSQLNQTQEVATVLLAAETQIEDKKLDFTPQYFESEKFVIEDEAVALSNMRSTISEENKSKEIIHEDGVRFDGENVDWSSVKYDSDLYWLAKLIHAESEGEPYIGKIAVGNVVINRTKNHYFADTIKGVIFEKNQFSVVGGRLNLSPNQESINAAYDVLYNNKIANGMPENVLYFNTFGRWSWTNKINVWQKIGNHYFGIQNY